MQRNCDFCGSPYVCQKPSISRFCSSKCRGRNGGRPRCQVVVASNASDATDATGLVNAVFAELKAAGTSSTALGQLALLLADRLANTAGSDAGAAAISRELARTLTAALSNTKVVPGDLLDELRKRRDAKRGIH